MAYRKERRHSRQRWNNLHLVPSSQASKRPLQRSLLQRSRSFHYHDEWRKTRRYKKTDEKTAATTDANKKKLTIANELKTAFATNLCVSEEDIDKIIAKANGQEN
jgi:hypothetical protein